MWRSPALTLVAFFTVSVAFSDPVRLPTGATLDPATSAHAVGNFPLSAALAPEGDRVALLLCGWREQGLQIVSADGRVLQTIEQPAAFVGITFAPDGKSLWTSGGNDDSIHHYRWRDGAAEAAGTIHLTSRGQKKDGVRYPAGLAFSPDGRKLYVAENLSDSLAVIDIEQEAVVQRLRTGRYPYGVAVSKNGRVYVSAWGEEHVASFTAGPSGLLKPSSRIAVAHHPSAMLLDDEGRRLYVVSSTTDRVSVVDLGLGKMIRTLADPAPAGPGEGSTPNALSLSPDGTTLFVAEADNNSVAVFRLSQKTSGRSKAAGKDTLAGRIPVEWYPTALARTSDSLLVVNGKGAGTGPNPGLAQPGHKRAPGSTDYTLGQIRGSVMRLPLKWTSPELATMTKRVAAANGWGPKAAAAKYPFRHVIYVIKENRTYDQILGDLPGADGDPSLVYFPREVSPNHHALAERFGIFDRFFVNAEVSATGHNWSTAAYATEYTEKTVPSEYGARGRTYDYEGANRNDLVDEDDDVAAPSNGYLWNLALRKKVSIRNYGEYVVSTKDLAGEPGARNIPARRALIDVTNTDYPAWDLDIPDQKRADVWIADLEKFAAAGSMPALQILRLPNDHTSGAAAGKPTPRAYVADNDLALGRIVEALSRSPFWKDTVMFVLEDDAQNGPDHVDSHRSPLLVISAYNHPGVVHRFANTTDVLATIEDILGLDSMSNFDRFGRPLRGIFASEADAAPYKTLVPSVDLNEKNPPATPAAKASELLDFSRPDAADDHALNAILWSVVKGDGLPMPSPKRAPAGAPMD